MLADDRSVEIDKQIEEYLKLEKIGVNSSNFRRQHTIKKYQKQILKNI